MSARERIENLWDRAFPVGPLLDDFAHELAEEIREHPWSEGCAAGCCDDDRGAQKAADRIDPKVKK